MTPLRLVDDSGQYTPTDRLPFPCEAAKDIARQRIDRIAQRIDAPQSTEAFERFARELETRLEIAQQQLDQIAGDVDSFSFSKYAKNDGGDRAA